jgi:hypothetical protein
MKEGISFDEDPQSLMELLRKVYIVTSDPGVLNALGALKSQHAPNSVLSPPTAVESYKKAFQNSWLNTPSLPAWAADYVFELPAAVQLASANSSAQRYSYYDISKASIRLLRIKDIVIMDSELTTHKFSKVPEYFALSYVWGSEKNPVNIRVNGQSLVIGKNLHLALSCLSPWLQKQSIQYICIDAICIDQKNNIEKLAQINNTCNIYRRPKQVIAFLDTHSDSAEKTRASDTEREASQMCLALIQLTQMTFENAKGDKDSIVPRILSSYRNPDQFPSNLKPKHGDRMWEFLFQLFESPWWQRAWVVQEVYCSPNTMVVFGGIVMSFSAVATFNVHMLQLVAHMVMELNETSYFDSYYALNRASILITAGMSARRRGAIESHSLRQTADGHIPLLQALDMVGKQHCTHCRDKVIAALGIASIESSKINLPGLLISRRRKFRFNYYFMLSKYSSKLP